MKKAFTMLELVFVIVIVGILSVMIAPSFQRNTLQEAADQVVSHIRYTQHLAMMDNKFDRNDAIWFAERWQLHFSNTLNGSNNLWAYSIYSDNNHDGNPNESELAINPLDTTKRLTGGYSGTVEYDEPEATQEMLIGKEYGISDIDFIGGCTIAITRERVFFDYQGRPFYGNAHAQTSSYKDETNSKLLKTQCRIQLCSTSPCTAANNDDIIEIAIEPETGYTHIL